MSSSAQIAARSEAWWSSLVSVSNRKEQRPDRGPVFGVCSGFVGAYIVFRVRSGLFKPSSTPRRAYIRTGRERGTRERRRGAVSRRHCFRLRRAENGLLVLPLVASAARRFRRGCSEFVRSVGAPSSEEGAGSRAHNPEVVGSNPTPATGEAPATAGVLHCGARTAVDPWYRGGTTRRPNWL